ncbi:MAG: hypothetical protein K6B67_01545 [Lachnospiraceae bacterium]|nr:hypothetical protein [Lachnospiraceae bacterium]
MTIRPLEFNAMLQNTGDATRSTANEAEKGALQQQNVTSEVKQLEEQAANSVMTKDDVDPEKYSYGDKEGDGSGYAGNKNKKVVKKKKKENVDGQVLIKGDHGSFDMKV